MQGHFKGLSSDEKNPIQCGYDEILLEKITKQVVKYMCNSPHKPLKCALTSSCNGPK